MRCVFHDENTPSLSVSSERNLYHCFGCGAAGSVIDWVMKTQGVSLPHAVQLLRNDALLEGAEKVGVTRSHARHLPSLAAGSSSFPTSESESAALLRSVADSYHANLKQSPEALAYLESRGLVHPELIEHFQLGYANKTLTYRLPPGHTQAGRLVRQQLQAVGVLRSTGHEHLKGCLVVPVLGLDSGEQAGRVMQLYGRRMQPNNKVPANQPRHLYLATPLRGVWNEAALMASTEIILCESLIDAMTFWCAGLRNVIAAFGVNGFTSDHWRALKHHGTPRVVIAFDRDEAGDKAADKLAEELRAVGIEVFRLLFPQGMDANAFALQVEKPGQALGELLQQAVWQGKGDLLLTVADRIWRVRGWKKNLGPEQMRGNVFPHDS